MNKYPDIGQKIHKIMFPHLQSLSLNGNMIESIEGLNRIFMPELTKLFISKNDKIKMKIQSVSYLTLRKHIGQSSNKFL